MPPFFGAAWICYGAAQRPATNISQRVNTPPVNYCHSRHFSFFYAPGNKQSPFFMCGELKKTGRDQTMGLTHHVLIKMKCVRKIILKVCIFFLCSNNKFNCQFLYLNRGPANKQQLSHQYLQTSIFFNLPPPFVFFRNIISLNFQFSISTIPNFDYKSQPSSSHTRFYALVSTQLYINRSVPLAL